MMHLNRRQFLRNLGVSAAALPFLAGLPSLTGAPLPQRRQRLIIMFSPNGTLPDEFWPDAAGELNFKSILEPLAAFRDRTLMIHGVHNKIRGDGDGHMRGMSCLLTCAELLPGNIMGGGGDSEVAEELAAVEVHHGKSMDRFSGACWRNFATVSRNG